MLEENKNVKDPEQKSLTSYRADTSSSLLFSSANKTNKLITALYMVTDTMEKDEPIRLRLRTLAIEILSDIASSQKVTLNGLDEKIASLLSFLNIAIEVRMISEMNGNILKKEFIELKESIREFTKQNNLWFEEFMKNSPIEGWPKAGVDKFIPPPPKGYSSRGELNSNGHATRIGVQKGNTLMKALSNVGHKDTFEALKNKRREKIIAILKKKPDGISIKDIMLAVHDLGEDWGEKTLQRELISMVKDSVLKKTGEKRWSLYFIN